MKGKISILVIVALITLLVVTPSLAAGPRNGHGLRHGAPAKRQGGGGGGGGQDDQSFNLYGVIQGLDPVARTIEVEVETPTKLIKYNPLTVQTTGSTRFKECDPDIQLSWPIEFEDLIVGRSVRIAGTVDEDGSFIAARVIQYIP